MQLLYWQSNLLLSSSAFSFLSETFLNVAGVCPNTDSALRQTCLTLGPLTASDLDSVINYNRNCLSSEMILF